jgi:Zn-finger protein
MKKKHVRDKDFNLNYFEKQLDFANSHFSFQDCSFYPCHKIPFNAGEEEQKGLNCFFCYCPFYPCKNRVGTGKWLLSADGRKVWDCSDCVLVHRNDVVKKILECSYGNKKFKQIKKIVKEEFCGDKRGSKKEKK